MALDRPWADNFNPFAHSKAATTVEGSKVIGSRGLVASNIVPLRMHSTLNHIIVDKTNLEKGNITANDHLG